MPPDIVPDSDSVIRIMREVAAIEILPRFGRLAADDISAKSHPSDLVTTADLAAEQRLTERLTDLAPGSAVVGEEGVEAEPARLGALAGDAPVWLLDPVDGTNNFAHGKPCFATIVAYCVGGETLAGWILDPLGGSVVWAVRGGGAWRDNGGATAAVRAAATQAVTGMTGTVGYRLAKRLKTHRERFKGRAPLRTVRSGSTGRDYMDLGQGILDFAQYTRLKPWDHAAGVLIHAEAGGVSRLVQTGAPYRAGDGIVPHTLLMAPDPASWAALHDVLAEAAQVGVP
ncbi:MAG: inositol monophosphatase [Rhodospirillales bacterium]|nr:inositol monophosphatase [Rhodospirillales bacterium]